MAKKTPNILHVKMLLLMMLEPRPALVEGCCDGGSPESVAARKPGW